MVIERNIYLERLKERMHNGMIKVITGVRRCGKSFLLFNIFYNYLKNNCTDDRHIIRIALDDLNNAPYLDSVKLYSYIKSLISDEKMHYVLLDEIQLVPDFEKVLNSLLHIANVDCYVTGSNSRFLSSDIITEFRGRGDEIRVCPLSFAEFFSTFEGDKQEAWREYSLYGGMPQCLLMHSGQQKEMYLKNLFVQTYVADIVNRYNIQSTDNMLELTQTLASSIGSLTNPTNIHNTFVSTKKSALSRNTIVSYINYLEDAFIVEKALRYDIKGKQYINTPQKYYFVDMGLRNALLNFRQLDEGHIMENIIYNELRAKGLSVDVGQVTQTFADKNKRIVRKHLEVDFVVNRGTRRYYIQSAAQINDEEKLYQETASMLNIGDSFKKIIINGSNQKPWYNEHGILILSLTDFLLNPEMIDF